MSSQSKSYGRAYYAANRERIRAQVRARRRANPEVRRRGEARYRAKHAEEHRARARDYYWKNRDKVLAQHAAKRPELRKKSIAYFAANRERLLAEARAHYAANREQAVARVLDYFRRNPAAAATANSRRRARKIGNGGSHTTAERRAKFAAMGNVCLYCGCGGKLTIDHDVPLSRGGTNNIDNILPACRSCNCRKRTRTAAEFIALLNATTEHASVST